MRKTTILATAAAVRTITGCAWVALEPRAEAVRVRAAGDVAGCKRLGKTRTRTLDRVVVIPRRDKSVREELERLARNEAVGMGGNAVSPLGPEVAGEQVFGVYACP